MLIAYHNMYLISSTIWFSILSNDVQVECHQVGPFLVLIGEEAVFLAVCDPSMNEL
jgi:hypothetical protein